MMTPPRNLIVLLSLALLPLAAIGCGDELDAEGDAPSDQGQDDPQSEEDCEDHEGWNPVTNECYTPDDDDDDDDDNGDECPPDQKMEDGECVDRCPVDEFWDEENEECVDIDGDCGEFEEWDPDDEVCVPTGECGPGEIIGQTCRPDEAVLPGAEITLEGIDCDGYEFDMETQADDQGYYEFEDVPAGTHELTVTSGSWVDTDDVTVQKGQTTDLTTEAAKLCLEGDTVDIAVLEGSFDDIGSILDGLGIDYELYGTSGSTPISTLVEDLDAMKDYDIIFAECGGSPGSSTAENNVHQFVESGHSLYASDLADDYIEALSHGIDVITFADQSGSAGTVTADVLTPAMQNLVGSTLDIEFDMGSWSIMESAAVVTEVHFEVDGHQVGMDHVDKVPLLAVFHDPIGGGRAIYTSFHNSAQADSEIEEIMEYMIFQL